MIGQLRHFPFELSHLDLRPNQEPDRGHQLHFTARVNMLGAVLQIQYRYQLTAANDGYRQESFEAVLR